MVSGEWWIAFFPGAGADDRGVLLQPAGRRPARHRRSAAADVRLPMTAIPLLDVRDLTVEFSTRRGIVKAVQHVDICRRQGRDRRHRRRVRLGQVGHVLRRDAHPRPRRPHRRRLGDVHRHRRARAPSEDEMRDLRGREMSMIFQNPRAALNPIRKVGRQIEDVLLAARAGRLRRRHREGDRAPRPGAHRAPARALSRLSVRAVRRHVPARRDRAGAGLPAAAADRRRADHRPRRDHAEDRDGPDRRADARARHVDHPDHPRSRPRRRRIATAWW